MRQTVQVSACGNKNECQYKYVSANIIKMSTDKLADPEIDPNKTSG